MIGKMNKALFLDRDGTLIRHIPYLCDPAKVELIDGVPQALASARNMGFLLFLFSNQSGVGRGYYTLDAVVSCNRRMEDLIGLPSPLFNSVCTPTEAPEEPSVYRKPSPAFALEMIRKHDLDPRHCYMVGDNRTDLQAAVNAGIIPIAVASGMQKDPRQYPEVAGGQARVFPAFPDFVRWLESEYR